MDWLAHDDFVALASSVRSDRAQLVSLFADTRQLASQLPVPRNIVNGDQGAPSCAHQWYARIGDRLLVVEIDPYMISEKGAVIIYTHYTDAQDEFGDWVVLRDCHQLPSSIFARRPTLIDSRIDESDWTVYRPDPDGWNLPIYAAASLSEAEDLIAFLTDDPWNRGCFVGKAEPRGKWGMIQGEEVLLGTGDKLYWTLKSACELTRAQPLKTLYVRDLSGSNSYVYTVRGGKVISTR